jgi:hypothetical protein
VSIESCTSGVEHKIREGRERDWVYKQRKEGNNGDVRYEEKQLEDIDEVRQVEGRLYGLRSLCVFVYEEESNRTS